jgi:hypothetical protein
VSTVEPPGLAAGLVAVDGFLGPDGASLAVEAWDAPAGRLSLRLILESADCAECVVPRPMLDTLLLETVRRHAPAVRAIALVDPRDTGSG